MDRFRVGDVSVIVPATGLEAEVEECVRAVLADGVADVTVVHWRSPEALPLRSRAEAAGERVLHVPTDRCAAALNHALEHTAGEVILFVVPIARLRPGLISSYRKRLQQTGAAAAYGDYDVQAPDGRTLRMAVVASPTDLSEFSGFGYVRAFRRDALDAIGGWDETLPVTEDYDLRLRLGERFPFAHDPSMAYDVVLPSDPSARAAVGAAVCRYFTPESVRIPGYGYLLLESRIADEVTHVFRSCLQRRGAYLDGPTESLHCPHGDARPLVSVVIPTFDRAAMLERAIETVRLGSFPDYEILVVDNGSSDGTIAMVERLARQDERIRLLCNPRPGIAAALNLGVRSARGKYVSQLDSDDEYTTDTLAQQVAHLEAHADWGLAISYYDVIDESGAPLAAYGIVRHEEYDRNTILRTGGAGAVRTWHRCVIDELGGFDAGALGSYGEDYDLVLRAAERFDVGRVHEVLYRVRMHPTNTEKKLDIRFKAERKAEARARALARRRDLAARAGGNPTDSPDLTHSGARPRARSAGA